MIQSKHDKGIKPEVIEALKGGKTLGAAAEASAEATDTAAEADGDYFDFIEAQQEDFRATVAKGDLPEPNAPVPRMPPTFEQVSLCSKGGGCRYLFRIVAPVAAKVYDPKAPGGMRPAMATIRRCLVGAVKLQSDDPIAVSAMKNLGTEAPYGVTECSHWSPSTDDELAAMNDRRLAGQARDAEQERLARVLAEDEVRAKRPKELVEDPDAALADAPAQSAAAAIAADEADEVDDGSPEPDFSAQPKPFPGLGAPMASAAVDAADGSDSDDE